MPGWNHVPSPAYKHHSSQHQLLEKSNWNIPDRRLAVRCHPSSKERTIWQRWCSRGPFDQTKYGIIGENRKLTVVLYLSEVPSKHSTRVRGFVFVSIQATREWGENGQRGSMTIVLNLFTEVTEPLLYARNVYAGRLYGCTSWTWNYRKYDGLYSC